MVMVSEKGKGSDVDKGTAWAETGTKSLVLLRNVDLQFMNVGG